MVEVMAGIQTALDIAAKLRALTKKLQDAEFSMLVAELNMQLADTKLEIAALKTEFAKEVEQKERLRRAAFA
jgi:uncharacterized coiled-coil protein SlyX